MWRKPKRPKHLWPWPSVSLWFEYDGHFFPLQWSEEKGFVYSVFGPLSKNVPIYVYVSSSGHPSYRTKAIDLLRNRGYHMARPKPE